MIFYFTFDDSRLMNSLTDTYQKIYVKDLVNPNGFAPVGTSVSALGKFDIEDKKDVMVGLSQISVFNVKTKPMEYMEINGVETLYLPIEGKGINKVLDAIKKSSTKSRIQPYFGIKIADVKFSTAKKYVDKYTNGPLELTVRVVKSDSGIKVSLDSSKTGKRVMFSNISAVENWIERLPERYRSILIPHYFDDVRKWGIGIVNTNKKEQKQGKIVFDTHVVKTGFRPRFVYLTRADSLNYIEDPDTVVTKAPESEMEASVDIKDQEQEEPQLPVGGKPPTGEGDMGFDLEDFM